MSFFGFSHKQNDSNPIIIVQLGPCNVITSTKSPYTQYSFRFKSGNHVHIFSERYSKLHEFNELLSKFDFYKESFGDNTPEFPKKRWFVDHTKPKQYKRRAQELLEWFQIIISKKAIISSSFFQNRIRLTKILKIAIFWNNKDICSWIEDINLSDSWTNIMINAIKNCECNGKDLININNSNDIEDIFGIQNPMLRNRMFREIRKLKGTSKQQKQSKTNKRKQDDKFKINIFSQGKTISLNEKVSKGSKISYIKRIYKQQTSVLANIDDIEFYAHSKVLPSYKTLEQMNIIDVRNLITVKFKAKDGVDDSNWNECGFCNKKKRNLRRCGRCKNAWYCDENCQRMHWKKHKYECKSPSKPKINKYPTCICSTRLQKRWIQTCYGGSGVICDECYQSLDDLAEEFVYHCPNEKIQAHINGYDLCIPCGQKQSICS